MIPRYLYDPWTKTLGIFPFKSGCTSLRNAFKHGTELITNPLIPDVQIVVMVVRQPEDRFDSLFSAKVPGHRYTSPDALARAILLDTDNPHMIPQCDYIKGLKVDYIIHLETVEADFEHAKQFFYGNPTLGHHNKTLDKVDAWAQLSDDLKQKLREKYDGDYTRFGYTPR